MYRKRYFRINPYKALDPFWSNMEQFVLPEVFVISCVEVALTDLHPSVMCEARGRAVKVAKQSI